MSSSRRRWAPGSTSEPERFVLQNEREIRIAKAILDALGSLRLTWLEGAVLHYYHFNGFHLYELPGLLNRRPGEIAEARRTLVRKAAAALGYIEHDEGLGPLRMRVPMSLEDRTRLVDEFLSQGLSWKEIGERLGMNPWTLWSYHKRVVGRTTAPGLAQAVPHAH